MELLRGQKREILTDSPGRNGGFSWTAVLDCLLNIIRALRMGTCLSSDRRRRWEYSPSSSRAGSRLLKKGSCKKFGSRGSSSSFESKRHGPAQSIPGKMFVNGASQIASLFTQQGKKGTNQDAMIVWENFGSRTDAVFCGVFDGHGPLGHMVAKKVRDSLPVKLRSHWDMIIHNNDSRKKTFNMTGSMNSEETSTCLHGEPVASNESVDTENNLEIFNILKESFIKAFKVMDKELRVHPNIDCSCSGTTAVTLVKQGQDLVIGNIGDSRAVLGTRDENNCLNAIQLTVDLKPNLPREAERIRRCKGRVFALRDEPDVARVWLPNNDSPGLAMARAFGDFCLKEFGLISVPEISYRQLTEKDEFIVLATDGIWDVLSNMEVVDVIASSPTRSSAAQSLVELAVQTWRHKYPTSKVDDCAVVCLFLNEDTSNNVASHTENQNNTETVDTPETSHGNKEIASENALPDTIRASCDVLLGESKKTPRQLVGSQSHKRPSNGNAGTLEMDELSVLEGVSRVNTLLTLPRLVVGGDRQSSDTTKIKK